MWMDCKMCFPTSCKTVQMCSLTATWQTLKVTSRWLWSAKQNVKTEDNKKTIQMWKHQIYKIQHFSILQLLSEKHCVVGFLVAVLWLLHLCFCKTLHFLFCGCVLWNTGWRLSVKENHLREQMNVALLLYHKLSLSCSTFNKWCSIFKEKEKKKKSWKKKIFKQSLKLFWSQSLLSISGFRF